MVSFDTSILMFHFIQFLNVFIGGGDILFSPGQDKNLDVHTRLYIHNIYIYISLFSNMCISQIHIYLYITNTYASQTQT